ncbi:MAG: hypothetical protein OXB90_04940 [Acidimicrobiaceae bacterium]|nr:hypothetical protein [Acidimicrobiaceae bacterium]
MSILRSLHDPSKSRTVSRKGATGSYTHSRAPAKRLPELSQRNRPRNFTLQTMFAAWSATHTTNLNVDARWTSPHSFAPLQRRLRAAALNFHASLSRAALIICYEPP